MNFHKKNVKYIKKKVVSGIAIVAIATLMVFNLGFWSKPNTLSGISLANVEALADENGGNICTSGCTTIGWGFSQILRCDCDYTGWFSSCDKSGCVQQ